MRKWLSWVSVLVLGGLLSACGGSDSNDDSVSDSGAKRPQLIVFGDSLSDSGSYAVPGIVAMGGGKFTINGSSVQIWTELLAAEMGLPAPCPAQTGLKASGPLAALEAPVENHEGCYAYAQGGSRVTHPVGPYNTLLLTVGNSDGALGQLTDPVINQIGRHLTAREGRFSKDDLVTVLAGANDVFMNLATVGVTTTPDDALAAMAAAATQLADYVKTQMIAKGARRVVVVLVPDISITPYGVSAGPDAQALINGMVQTFNGTLVAALAAVQEVLLVDAYTQSQAQAQTPAAYGLTNVSIPACDLTVATLGSLVCSDATLLVPPTTAEGFLYADGVHPTPTGHRLLFELVRTAMEGKGWL